MSLARYQGKASPLMNRSKSLIFVIKPSRTYAMVKKLTICRGKAMTIALQELSQRFAAAVHGAMPSADLLPLQDIQRAENRLGQLAQRLAPYVHGEATVSEESLARLAKHYIANP